jgi:plastocyanin
MIRLRTTRLVPILVGLLFSIPALTYAGGGGGPAAGGLVINVDHMTPMNQNFSFLDYFPRIAYVHQGDVVTFRWSANANALHTVTLLPAGVAPTNAALAKYFPGANGVPDSDDSGAAAKGIIFDIQTHMMTGCGNSAYYPGTGPCVYTGAAPLNSGFMNPATNGQGRVDASVPLPQFVVRMNAAPGSYHWFCLIHGGGMNGTIHVLPAGAPIPSLAAQAAAAQRQYQFGSSRAIAHANALNSSVPGPTTSGGHTNWKVQAGGQYGRVEIDEYFPHNITVKPGDSVTWLPGGFHTVTTPGFPQPALQAACEGSNGKDTPFRGNFACGFEVGLGPGALPSGPSGQSWTGQPLNSGIVVVPQPHTWTVSFPKAGTFHYVCYIHRGQAGSITIQ